MPLSIRSGMNWLQPPQVWYQIAASVRERMYWRYDERGYRYLHLDAGHVCQNLYLAAGAVQAGTVAMGALLMGSQELADPLRQLIEHEVDLSTHHSTLLNGNGQLPHAILKAWNDWHQSWES